MKAVGLGIDEGAEIGLGDIVVLWHGWLGMKHRDTSERQGFGDSDKGGLVIAMRTMVTPAAPPVG